MPAVMQGFACCGVSILAIMSGKTAEELKNICCKQHWAFGACRPTSNGSMHSCNYVCQHLDILHAFDHSQSQMFNRKDNAAL